MRSLAALTAALAACSHPPPVKPPEPPRAACKVLHKAITPDCAIAVTRGCLAPTRTLSVLTTKRGAKACAKRAARLVQGRQVALMFVAPVESRLLMVWAVLDDP